MLRTSIRRPKTAAVTSQEKKTPFWPIQNAISQVLEDFYAPFEAALTGESLENMALVPSVDIIDTKNSIKLEAELPGMGLEDIKVAINNGVLTITGEKKMSRQDKDKNYLVREVSYGYYQRSVPLPDSIDVNAAKCTFKKGMLWVELPKKAEAIESHRELKIESAESAAGQQKTGINHKEEH